MRQIVSNRSRFAACLPAACLLGACLLAACMPTGPAQTAAAGGDAVGQAAGRDDAASPAAGKRTTPPVAAAKGDEDFLEFFVGSYDIVGRWSDGGATYAGSMEIASDSRRLRLVRTIAGERSAGTATLERQTADRIRVIVATFLQSGEKLTAWCCIGSDLDSGPRLTCLVRPQARPAAAPGLEAWFFRQPAP